MQEPDKDSLVDGTSAEEQCKKMLAATEENQGHEAHGRDTRETRHATASASSERPSGDGVGPVGSCPVPPTCPRSCNMLEEHVVRDIERRFPDIKIDKDSARSKSLRVLEIISNQYVCIDTGAVSGLWPATPEDRLGRKPCSEIMVGANGEEIVIWRTEEIKIDIGLGKTFTVNFAKADTPDVLIGCDLLDREGVLVDVRNNSLWLSGSLNSVTAEPCERAAISYSKTPAQVGLYNMIDHYSGVFRPQASISGNNTKPKLDANHEIHLRDSHIPVKQKAHRISEEKLIAAQEALRSLETRGIIKKSSGDPSYASPMVMVRKANGTYSPCWDFRHLNSQIRQNNYGIPHLLDYTKAISGCSVFSKIVLTEAFYHIPLDQKTSNLTTISTPFGHYEFIMLPFTLKNAAEELQSVMTKMMAELAFVFVYLDNVIVFSKADAEHAGHVAAVLDRLLEHGLEAAPHKSVFGVPELTFLGHEISGEGVRPIQSRVDAVGRFPRPETVKSLQVRFIIGLTF